MLLPSSDRPDITLNPGVIYSGHVADATDNSIFLGGGRLELQGDNYAEGPIYADGSFALTLQPGSTYSYRADLSAELIYPPAESMAGWIDSDLTDQIIPAAKGVPFEITAINQNCQRVPGLEVDLRNEFDEKTVTDPNGYALAPAFADTVQLDIGPQDYFTQPYATGRIDAFTIPPWGMNFGAVTVYNGYLLTGNVVNQDGDSIWGNFHSEYTGTMPSDTPFDRLLTDNETSDQGEITGRAYPGQTEIGLDFRDYNDEHGTRYMSIHDSTNITADTDLGTYVAYEGVAVTGSVEDANGDPVSSVDVYCQNSTHGQSDDWLDYPDNQFQVLIYPDEDYDCYVWDDSYQTQTPFPDNPINCGSDCDQGVITLSYRPGGPAPDTYINSWPPDPSSSPDASFDFSCNQGGCSYECQLDMGGWSGCSSPQDFFGLSQGSHLFQVRAWNNGQVDPMPASYHWSYILGGCQQVTGLEVAPAQAFIGEGDAVLFDATCTLADSSTLDCTYGYCGIDTFWWRMGPLIQLDPRNLFQAPMFQGSDTVFARIDDGINPQVWDNAEVFFGGVSQPETYIDSAPPNPSFSDYAYFEFSCDQGNCNYECQLDNQGWYGCSAPQEFFGLGQGSHNFQVRAWHNGMVDPSPASYDWSVILGGCQQVVDLIVEPAQIEIAEGSTVSFTAICTLEDSSRVDCTVGYCGTLTQWYADGDLDQLEPPNLFEAQMGGEWGQVAAYYDDGENEPVENWAGVTIYDVTTPDTYITQGPPEPSNSRDAQFEFTCNEPNCAYECKLDNGGWFDCGSPYQYFGIPDGGHTFQVRARDQAWHYDPTPAAFSWTIDATPPDTNLTSTPPSYTADTFATFEFNCNEGSCAFECNLDSSGFSPCVSPKDFTGLAEGSHTFEVRATDGMGNTDPTPAAYSWLIDLTPVDTFITSHPADPSNDWPSIFEFNCNKPGCTYECRLDSGGWSGCDSPYNWYVGDGFHLFEVRAYDQNSIVDSTPAAYSWQRDSIGPTTSIDSQPANPSADPSPEFTFSCNESYCDYQCRVDGSGYYPCSSPEEVLGLGEGGHWFYVRAFDLAGNPGTEPGYNWYIDLSGPETYLNSYPPDPSSSADASFSFSCSEGGCSYECQLDSSGWASCSSPQNYTGLAEGPHEFQVRALDALGNPDDTPAVRDWTIDLMPPDTYFTVVPDNPTAAYPSHFEFACDEPPCTFQCNGNAGGWGDCTSPFDWGLWSETEATLEVRAIDQAGNTDPSPASYSYRIDHSSPETTILTHPPDPDNQDPATFTFVCNESWGCNFECQIDSLGWVPCVSPLSYPGLVAGSHFFEVRAIDLVGHVDASPASYSWQIFMDRWYPTRANAPAKRFAHAAVWTGTEMIIWGGMNVPYPYTTLNTGARYNPASDTWIPTIITNAPNGVKFPAAVWDGQEAIVAGGMANCCWWQPERYQPAIDTWVDTPSMPHAFTSSREGFSTVWTGQEMILWGGLDGGVYNNVGDRYDPATDLWSEVPTAGAPSPREYHQAVWDGNSMIIWGGWDGDIYYNDGSKYNPATNDWTPISPSGAPGARAFHTAVWDDKDMEMIVWGGYDGTQYLNDGAKYNSGSNSWSSLTTDNAPSPRYLHTATWAGTEMIVFGGYDGEYYFNDGGKYDPASDTWTPISTDNAPSPRVYHSAVWTDTELIIWGGYNWDGTSEYCFNDGGRYNPDTDSWTPTSVVSTVGAPSPREYHTAVWTGAEMIVWGGYYYYYDTSSHYVWYNNGARYNPVTDSWIPTSTVNAPAARERHTAVWTGSKMVVWGGRFWPDYYSDYGDGGRYDPATDSWSATSLADAPSARSFHTAIWTGTEMIVWGGCYGGSCGTRLNTGGRYNPATDLWTPTSTGASVPSPRNSHSAVWAVYGANQRMIVWGGYTDSGSTNTGGRYNPSLNAWSPVSITNVPDARTGHTAVWTTGLTTPVMIIFGANGNTGGRYNPNTNFWQGTATTNAPNMSSHTALWTGSEMVVCRGGCYRYNPVADNWKQAFWPNEPALRNDATAVWTGSKMIIWGGYAWNNSTGYDYTDTGGIWTP